MVCHGNPEILRNQLIRESWVLGRADSKRHCSGEAADFPNRTFWGILVADPTVVR